MDNDPLVFRPAAAGDAPLLSELALRSKAHWGYQADFIAACRDELRVTARDISSPGLYYTVVVNQRTISGFYALKHDSDERIELEAMFIEPGMIGTGIGRALLEHARQMAAGLGARRMIIQSDPYAEGFYRAAGAKLIGQRESGSIPGRLLPELQLDLHPASA